MMLVMMVTMIDNADDNYDDIGNDNDDVSDGGNDDDN